MKRIQSTDKRIQKLSKTTANQFYERQSKIYTATDEKNNQEAQERQILQEYSLLQHLHTYCNLQYRNADKIQTRKVEQLGQRQFFNPDVMQTILCTLNALFIGSNNLPVNQRVKHWLKVNRVLNAGAHGYAMEAQFENAKDLILIKGQGTELVHELFVGIQLNTLRSQIPNFSYVFGGFRCLPAFLENKSVKTWCNDPQTNRPSSRLQYIMYENIKPSISMKEYCSNHRFSDFLNKYIQILFAVNMAYEKFDFTHYDLHSDNVLIRSIPDFPKFSIEYKWKRNSIYVPTDAISTIIDYGLSHIRVEDKTYGVYGYQNYNIQPEESNPLYDAYKLLITSIKTIADRELAIPLIQYFTREVTTREELDDFIDTQMDIYSILPPMDKRLTLENYIEYVIENYNVVIQTQVNKTYPLLSCREQICSTKGQIAKIFGFTEDIELQNLYDVYDYLLRNPEQESQIMKNENLSILIDDMQEQQTELLAQLRQFRTIPIYSYETSGSNPTRYKNYILNMIEYKNVYYDFLANNHILQYFKSQVEADIEEYKRNLEMRDAQIDKDYEKTKDNPNAKIYTEWIENYKMVFPNL